MIQHIKVWVKRLQKFANRWWYFPLLGVLAGIDLFILIVPTDAILISSVMLKPKKWVRAFVWVSLGASIGALALAAALQWDPGLVPRLFPGAFENDVWRWMDAFIDNHGGKALFLIALSPFVQFPAVAITALAGMPLTEIFLVCLAGRGIKAALFCYGASHAPKLLMKIPFIKQELSIVELPPAVK